MVAGLTAGIDRALLFGFEKLDQLGHGGFFDAESFLARMVGYLRARLAGACERSKPR